MKKITLLNFLALIFVVVLYSCSKESTTNPNPNPGAASQWVFNGITYNGSTTNLNVKLLYSLDTSGNEMGIHFGEVPTTNKTFTVNASASSDPAKCYLYVVRSGSSGYYSTGKVGDVVNVTITSGKITATFSNITVSPDLGATTKTVTGTLIEK